MDIPIAILRVDVNSVQCEDGRYFKVNQFKRDDPKAAYVAARDAGQLPPSPSENDIREYPYLSAEILGNTILADLQWLEAFVKNHWYSFPFIWHHHGCMN
jgi:hypothetical protein